MKRDWFDYDEEGEDVPPPRPRFKKIKPPKDEDLRRRKEYGKRDVRPRRNGERFDEA